MFKYGEHNSDVTGVPCESNLNMDCNEKRGAGGEMDLCSHAAFIIDYASEKCMRNK
jgi:hypothetical protein